MAEKGRSGSPWMGKDGDDRDPGNMPDDVREQIFEDDDDKIGRSLGMAGLMSTRIPAQANWPTCWSCGEKVPVVIRDPIDATLVCKACALASTMRGLCESLTDLVDDAAKLLFGRPKPGEDDEEPPENGAAEDDDEPPEKDGEPSEDDDEPPPVAPAQPPSEHKA